jgi:hypothetical protein
LGSPNTFCGAGGSKQSSLARRKRQATSTTRRPDDPTTRRHDDTTTRRPHDSRRRPDDPTTAVDDPTTRRPDDSGDADVERRDDEDGGRDEGTEERMGTGGEGEGGTEEGTGDRKGTEEGTEGRRRGWARGRRRGRDGVSTYPQQRHQLGGIDDILAVQIQTLDELDPRLPAVATAQRKLAFSSAKATTKEAQQRQQEQHTYEYTRASLMRRKRRLSVGASRTNMSSSRLRDSDALPPYAP